MEKILKWHSGILLPDLVLLIEISTDEAIKRLQKQKVGAEFFEKRNKLKKISLGYLKCVELFPNLIKKINGEKPKKEVFKAVKCEIDKLLNLN